MLASRSAKSKPERICATLGCGRLPSQNSAGSNGEVLYRLPSQQYNSSLECFDSDDRAFGADDVDGTLYNRQRVRKLRFLMTDNTTEQLFQERSVIGGLSAFSQRFYLPKRCGINVQHRPKNHQPLGNAPKITGSKEPGF
ncbi:MAG: hypothetical protein JWO80_3062 [Bryobacterales bacterium]|nr:hypothetical protein [Bryobacterales bacterium]